MRPVLSCFVAFFAAGLLAGCDPFASPDSMMQEYLERTARVLDGEAVRTPVPTLPQLPPRRERLRPMPELDVSLLDFLSLYGCELQHVVGERNSILGRVMHRSGLFAYELRFVQSARECLEEIDSERLATRIAEAVEQKREALPDALWNAIWGVSEIEDFLTRSKGFLPVRHDRDLAAVLSNDLRVLTEAAAKLEREELDVDVQRFDAIYQRWQAYAMAGQLLRSAAMLTARLDDTSRLIEARLGDRPVCVRPDVRPRTAESMQGMFMTVYVAQVQAYLADVQRARRDLVEPLLALARLGGEERTPAMAAYARAVLRDDLPGSLWHEFDRAVARHARAWQELLGQCGMRPGQQLEPSAG